MRPKIYLDANVFIMALEADQPTTGSARALLDAALDERLVVLTSAVTLSEVLVGPLRDNNRALADVYRSLLSGKESAIRVLPVDAAALEGAAELRAQHKTLTLPDALHLDAARRAKPQWFVSNDTRLPSTSGLRAVTPFSADLTDYLAALP